MSSQTKLNKCVTTHCTWRIVRGRNRYRLYGQTTGGRFLFVVLEHIQGTMYKPITARDMTEGEKRGYRRLRR